MSDRVELRVNGLVVYESGAVVPPKPVEPPKPVPPVVVSPPAGFNPFIAWRDNGGDLVAYVMWRNNGLPLSPAQLEQAYVAGYPRPAPPPGGGGGDRAGFYVSYDNSPRVNILQNDQPYTFTFERGGKVRIFPAAGSQLNKVNGQNVIGGLDIDHYSGAPLVVTVEGVGAYGPPEVAVQLQ